MDKVELNCDREEHPSTCKTIRSDSNFDLESVKNTYLVEKKTIDNRCQTKFPRMISAGCLQRYGLEKRDKNVEKTGNQQSRPSLCPGCY